MERVGLEPTRGFLLQFMRLMSATDTTSVPYLSVGLFPCHQIFLSYLKEGYFYILFFRLELILDTEILQELLRVRR